MRRCGVGAAPPRRWWPLSNQRCLQGWLEPSWDHHPWGQCARPRHSTALAAPARLVWAARQSPPPRRAFPAAPLQHPPQTQEISKEAACSPTRIGAEAGCVASSPGEIISSLWRPKWGEKYSFFSILPLHFSKSEWASKHSTIEPKLLWWRGVWNTSDIALWSMMKGEMGKKKSWNQCVLVNTYVQLRAHTLYRYDTAYCICVCKCSYNIY